ncbi:MAG: hypothetical protein HZC22_08865 [Rhodocyclales bacterium]|nr:hypothetical protein [Rhodocyclales bacterium]
MRKNSLIIAAVVIVLAFVLNPSADRHREKINTAVTERNPIAGLFGAGAITALTSGYYSLGVASYTKANDRIVSVGFMGMVFVL